MWIVRWRLGLTMRRQVAGWTPGDSFGVTEGALGGRLPPPPRSWGPEAGLRLNDSLDGGALGSSRSCRWWCHRS
jgi:hypothetical protein